MKRMDNGAFDAVNRGATCTRRTLFAVMAAAATSCLFAPALALAEDASGAVAFSLSDDGATRLYYSHEAAVQAACAGNVVFLNADWQLAETLSVAEGQTLVINMNGHKIAGDGSATVIHLGKSCSLTLQCSKTGGLLTGGNSSSGAGGIQMDDGSTLVLDNVVVAGNCGKFGGGVGVDQDCTVYLRGGASIRNNSGRFGGGVYSHASGTTIHLENHSAISENYATEGGGGIFFYDSRFSVCSDDGTGCISGNKTGGVGGAVDTYSVVSASNSAEFSGITFSENHADGSCGAIELRQSGVTFRDCDFLDNSAGTDAGAVRLGLECDASMEGCTVSGNYCSDAGVGGGIVCNEGAEVALSGAYVIDGNTRGKHGTPDDLQINEPQVGIFFCDQNGRNTAFEDDEPWQLAS